jgi:Tfp pilus assembly protein PilF
VGAAATLERALRIEPQEAYLWNRLARVRMEQGRYTQAGDLALRSNSLSSEVALKQDNWSVIAAARRAAGDTAGAMEAEQKARGG